MFPLFSSIWTSCWGDEIVDDFEFGWNPGFIQLMLTELVVATDETNFLFLFNWKWNKNYIDKPDPLLPAWDCHLFVMWMNREGSNPVQQTRRMNQTKGEMQQTAVILDAILQ